ncbi:SBBP repeat-containing protein [Gloeobacter violaceus]|nr:SBBP repeat-containing protein [Gloeobacter violaceus]
MLCPSRRSLPALLALLVFVFANPPLLWAAPTPAAVPPPKTPAPLQATLELQANQNYGRLPVSFEPNVGQTDERVKFLARAGGHRVFLMPAEAVFVPGSRPKRNLPKLDARPQSGPTQLEASGPASVVRMELVGANRDALMEGLSPLPGKVNYLKGNNPKQWRTNIGTYGRVRVQAVYRGIDLVYHSDNGRLEYDFVVAPGANPGRIRLRFGGGQKVLIDKDGALVVKTQVGEVRQPRPVVYQRFGAGRRVVPGQYVQSNDKTVGFQLGRYDRTRPLVIDPTLAYSTYLGGNDYDFGTSIAVDGAGNAYVTGYTYSTNFPAANALQPTIKGTNDVFVSKLNASGNALVYSTYLGGSDDDDYTGIAVDEAGNAYVEGNTASTNFPTANALQLTNKGKSDVFVSKIDISKPNITGFSPTSGAIGTAVTVTGVGFANATRVDFANQTPAPFTIVSDNEIVATVNAGSKTGKIVVLVPNGRTSSPTKFTVTP